MFEKKPLTPLEKEFVELLKKGDYRDLYFLIMHEKIDPNCIFKTKDVLINIFSNSHASHLVSFLKKIQNPYLLFLIVQLGSIFRFFLKS